MMRVLVTGVAGFIGSNLAARLLEDEHEIVGIDDMSHGHELNVAAFAKNPRFQFNREDVLNEDAMHRLSAGCSHIVHLAARKIPRYSDALDTLKVNAWGTEIMARAALNHDATLVVASTSDCYGKNPDVPFSEESNLVVGAPTVRRWAYSISKMFSEQMLFAYHERHGLKTGVIRFFGGYGPAQNLTWWGGPQSVFINAALDAVELEVHGDGQQTRSFTFVDDHVTGIRRVMDDIKDKPEVFNIGATREIAILDLAKLIWRLVRGDKSVPKIKMIPYATFGKYEDVMRRIPNMAKANKLLGYSAETPLEEGLRRTIHWQVARRRALGTATPDPAC
jgi:UDP-glucose 4-epimerase